MSPTLGKTTSQHKVEGQKTGSVPLAKRGPVLVPATDSGQKPHTQGKAYSQSEWGAILTFNTHTVSNES